LALAPRFRVASAGVTKEAPPRAPCVAGSTAFAEAGITHKDVDQLMIYGGPCSLPAATSAHLPIYVLEKSWLRAARRGRGIHRQAQHRPRRKLPLNTKGGGLSYMHPRMYGMYALQESVR
jgi:hypothetical protein